MSHRSLQIRYIVYEMDDIQLHIGIVEVERVRGNQAQCFITVALTSSLSLSFICLDCDANARGRVRCKMRPAE